MSGGIDVAAKVSEKPLDRDWRVLVIAGEPYGSTLVDVLRREASGFEVSVLHPGAASRAVARTHHDVYLLGALTVGALCRSVRTLRPDGAIVAFGDPGPGCTIVRRAALEGADEFLVAPIGTAQLAASLEFHVARRRARQGTRERGPFIVDPSYPIAYVFERPAWLTKGEARAMIELIDAEGPVARAQMRRALGYEDPDAESGAGISQLDRMMHRLRNTLDKAVPGAGEWIQVIDGRRNFQLADPSVAELHDICGRTARRSSVPPLVLRGSGPAREGRHGGGEARTARVRASGRDGHEREG